MASSYNKTDVAKYREQFHKLFDKEIKDGLKKTREWLDQRTYAQEAKPVYCSVCISLIKYQYGPTPNMVCQWCTSGGYVVDDFKINRLPEPFFGVDRTSLPKPEKEVIPEEWGEVSP